MDGAAGPRPCSRKDGSESHGKNPDLLGQGGDCDLAVRTKNIGIRKNWILPHLLSRCEFRQAT